MFNRSTSRITLSLLISAVLGVLATSLLVVTTPPPVSVQAASRIIHPRIGTMTDSPSVTITNGTATSSAAPTLSAHEAQIQWGFGTVSGAYTTCTVQTQTSNDGSVWLNLGSPASVTVTNNQVNAWSVMAQDRGASVTTSAVSSTSALGFGLMTQFVFACTAYGTSAPVSISVIYR